LRWGERELGGGDGVSIARDGRGRGRGGRVCPDQRPVGAEGKMTKGGGTAGMVRDMHSVEGMYSGGK
jgi:hypothetical protein